MKKILLVMAFIAVITSCKKDDFNCWICNFSAERQQVEVCGTERQIIDKYFTSNIPGDSSQHIDDFKKNCKKK
jgi:hypothetical protein